MSEGRVQLGVGGVVQLSVTFEDTQTALQQLEVPLQVRHRRHRWTRETQVERSAV